MISHSYELDAKATAAVLLRLLAGVVVLAGLLHATHALRLLPRPPAAASPDDAVLAFKSQVARSHHPAEILLLGDSSCLTGVDAKQLSELLPGRPRVLNLALIITLSLDASAEALSDFLERNPDQVRLVVVLVAPGKLKNEDLNPGHHLVWGRLRGSQAATLASAHAGVLARLAGAPILRRELLGHWLPAVARGPEATQYGFASVLYRHLIAHDGSLIDPREYHPPHRTEPAEFSLDSSFAAESRILRQRVPRGVVLAAGLTPVPEALVGRSYRPQRDDLLHEWQESIQADHLFLSLPARLPNGFFATGAHLNRRGQEYYTRLLAVELAGLWAAARPPQVVP